MTHKSYYEAAAAEVTAGHLDSALWIKVNADMPNADNGARQAKYIALRAQELAAENTEQSIRRWIPRSRIAQLLATVVIAVVVSAGLGSVGGLDATPVPIIVFAAIVIGGLFWTIRRTRAASGASRSAAAPSSTQAR